MGKACVFCRKATRKSCPHSAQRALTGTGKTVGEDATFQVPSGHALYLDRYRAPVRVALLCQGDVADFSVLVDIARQEPEPDAPDRLA